MASSILCVGAVSCATADRAEIELRVVTAPGDDPFVGASELVISLLQGGEHEPIASERYEVTATSGELERLPFGSGYQVEVEALSSETEPAYVLARGRSYPFAVDGVTDQVEPHVLVAQLGRFVEPIPGVTFDAEVEAVAATEGGALIATRESVVWRFRTHRRSETGRIEPALEQAASLPEHAGGSWSPLGDGLLVVGGDGGAALVGAGGEVIAELESSTLEDHRYGAALVGLSDGSALIVGGGRSRDGAPSTAVTRVDVDRSTQPPVLDVSHLESLPSPRRGARAVAVETVGLPECPCEVVVVLGGTGSGGESVESVVSIDPEGRSPAAISLQSADFDHVALTTLVTPAIRGERALELSSAGFVLLAGGVGADGEPQGATRMISTVFRERDRLDVDFYARPPDLFDARSGAGAIIVDVGLVLIVGGVGEDGAPLQSAELFDLNGEMRLSELSPTGSLPLPMASPRGARLHDGSVLVAAREGLALYQSPR